MTASSWPEAVQAQSLFQDLLNPINDPTARAEFAAAFLVPLVAALQSCRNFRKVDPHLIQEASGRAIADILRRPEIYNPEKSELQQFLLHSAQCDLLTLLKKDRHWREFFSGEFVADAIEDGNSVVEESPDEELHALLAHPSIAEVLEEFSEIERAVFEQMRRGGELLEIQRLGHLPLDERKRELKRIRDRILIRLKRAWRKVCG